VERLDDIDLEADAAADAPVAVQRLQALELVSRNGRKQLHSAWEPLSFRQQFNRDGNDWRTDDFTHDWLMSHTNDGSRLMGSGTAFGQVRAAFAEVGVTLTKNDAMAAHVGKIFKTTRVREVYSTRVDLDDAAQMAFSQSFALCSPDEQKQVRSQAAKSGSSYYTKPLELLTDYDPPANPKLVRIGFKDTMEVAEATPQQIAALKVAMNGTTEGEYVDAIMDSLDNLIICDPFMGEAGDGAAMTERLVSYGGVVDSAGRITF